MPFQLKPVPLLILTTALVAGPLFIGSQTATAAPRLVAGRDDRRDPPDRATASRTLSGVVLILVDDMGFSDPGCYGGEIETPALDALAAGGLRFSQFYNTGRCWPTRAALLTGRYPHEAGNAMRFGPKAPPAYRGTDRSRGLMISEALKPAGWRSYHVGKWHLNRSGAPDETWPLRRGFNRSLFSVTQNNYFNPKIVYDEREKITRPGENADYYQTRAISDRAVAYLKEHDAQHQDAPFFLYLAYTAPHFPLHALPEDVAKYKGKYDVGWDVVRKRRYERLKKMGLVDCKLSPRDDASKPWESLSADEKRMWSERMSLHAAMVHRIDVGVGRVVAQLKEMHAFDDTLILFLSDNGASAEYLVRGDGHDPAAAPGSRDTYLCLEVGWSNASNSPFRQHKMWTHEGGVSTPLIAHWPNSIPARGGLTHAVGHVIDVLPTIIEAAGVDAPREYADQPVPPVTGTSLLPVFEGVESTGRDEVFWEHVGNRALRQGDWKLVAEHNQPWELYNLKRDRSETNDLAGEQPALVRKLSTRWQKLADDMGVVPWDSLPQSKRSPGGDYRRK